MSNPEPRKARSKTVKNANFTLMPQKAFENLDAPRIKRHELTDYEDELAKDEAEARGGWHTEHLGFFSRFWRA